VIPKTDESKRRKELEKARVRASYSYANGRVNDQEQNPRPWRSIGPTRRYS
jgi:hypothetical protein